MTYEEIIANITEGLTGDPEVDLEYLKSQMDIYKDHEKGQEIIRACGRLIYNLMPDDAKEEIGKIMNREDLKIDSIMDEIHFAIYEKKIDKAVSLITELANKADELHMYENDSVSEYYCFESTMEEALYKIINQPERDVRASQYPYARVYLEQGSVYFEAGMYEEAEKALEKARRWNPVNIRIASEYMETIKMRKDWDAFKNITIEMFKYAFKREDVARLFRNLGFYFVEMQDYVAAKLCYTLSLNYESDNKNAMSELYYIDDLTKGQYKLPSEDEAEKIAEKYGFPMGVNPDVLGIAFALGKQCLEEGQVDGIRYFMSIVYDLTRDDEIKKILDSLPEIED